MENGLSQALLGGSGNTKNGLNQARWAEVEISILASIKLVWQKWKNKYWPQA